MLVCVGVRWWALVGVGVRATPRSPPEKAALHTKSAQTAGLEAIWCEVRRKILQITPVWWLFRFESALMGLMGSASITVTITVFCGAVDAKDP
ncbi:hypothetical protein NG01_06870 [Corynebacterium diphtheriae]|nr:hypothetical protein NG01_06870 [Corynebacterium diphtheriae]